MAVKPDYRLQTVLEIRERKKEECERKLGEAMAALKVEKDKQKQMEDELERMIQKREQKKREYAEKAMRGEMAAADVVNANTYIERLKEQEEAQKNAIEGQKAVVAQKQELCDQARNELTRAMQDLKAMEKHKEKFNEEWKKEQAIKEENTMDELAQQIFIRREE
jgi:flagellar export protein FliJ